MFREQQKGEKIGLPHSPAFSAVPGVSLHTWVVQLFVQSAVPTGVDSRSLLGLRYHSTCGPTARPRFYWLRAKSGLHTDRTKTIKGMCNEVARCPWRLARFYFTVLLELVCLQLNEKNYRPDFRILSISRAFWDVQCKSRSISKPWGVRTSRSSSKLM